MPAELRWEAGRAEPGGEPRDWLPARVPGTAAGALRDAGLWEPGDPLDLDAEDWWFRTRFAAGDETVLRLDGVATVADVHLNGELVLESRSMFLAHEVDLRGRLRGENELTIRCRALAPLLAERRQPRARWRTRVADGNLRFHRTSILGRAPGFAPGPAPVGPWRPVTLGGPRPRVALGTAVEGADGVVSVDGREVLRIPDVERWWPHTHGEPRLYDVEVAGVRRRVGFRTIEPGPAYDVDAEGLALRVNGVPVFARGAVWTPVDAVAFADQPRAALEQARDAGMNMLRLAGTGVYETDTFHDLCDELGILVWQDFMFANMDYPLDVLRADVEEEARQLLRRVVGRPSTAVLCGNSEVEQQVAMLGLDPALGRGELFGELLPGLARAAGADVPYVPSAPSGGALPFRFDRGVAHYFGVGGYRRPLADARLADVRFASECLAFANLPDEPPFAPVPQDVGADWDFADVREHYRALVFGDRADEELSRAAPGEAMAEVFGEWRRAGSPCAGGLVLWLRDLGPGAGWGLVDHRGNAKLALGQLARVLAPVAVWTTDEGLAGIDVHVANDRPEPLAARLRVALYRDFELPVDGAEEALALPPHGAVTRNVEALLGRFVDASYTYRFGPPGHHAVVASLETDAGLLSQAFRFPAGPPLEREPPALLGLHAEWRDGAVAVRSRRLAYGVRIRVPGCVPADDGFSIEPGGERLVPLRGAAGPGTVTALNLAGAVAIA